MTNCPKCDSEIIAVQYEHGSCCAYDGISEYSCVECEYRVGRWSEKELKDGEHEPRYGQPTSCKTFMEDAVKQSIKEQHEYTKDHE